jgi:hypothetical protein
LLGNGSVSTVPHCFLGDTETSSRENAYITDVTTEMQAWTSAVFAVTNALEPVHRVRETGLLNKVLLDLPTVGYNRPGQKSDDTQRCEERSVVRFAASSYKQS